MSITALEKALEDTVKLIELTRKGVAYSLYQTVAMTGPFTTSEWSSYLHITERTLQRYKKENKVFDPIYSEKILEIAQLQKRGKDIFGEAENFNRWMDSKIVALGGVKPKSLLDSSFGILLLNQELTRIEHGIFA